MDYSSTTSYSQGERLADYALALVIAFSLTMAALAYFDVLWA